MIKVFLGGEGSNDIGTRWHVPMGDTPGVVETLLRRVRAEGWRVAGARSWQSIRKYRAGGALGRAQHNDVHNVRGLVLHAYEEGCEMLVFIRDVDREADREHEIRTAVETIGALGFAETFRYELAIVAGVPRPNLEGWVLCLRGLGDTDEMSPDRVDRELAALGIKEKSTAEYVTIAQTCPLPSGSNSLCVWLDRARTAFRRLIDGESPV
jgi:hypothetical protein